MPEVVVVRSGMSCLVPIAAILVHEGQARNAWSPHRLHGRKSGRNADRASVSSGGCYNSTLSFACMSLGGNLNTMTPADLLQWLSLGQKTGTLVLSGRGVEKRIFFRRGRILSSASTDPREYLGQFLVSHGYITEEELKKAMEVQAQSKILLGKILVMIDAISEDDLVRLMRLKAEEEIYDIFLWGEGDFHFVDDELPTMQLIPLQIDVTGIILEGTRRLDEWRRMRQVVGEISAIPSIVHPVDESQLSEVQLSVVQAVNGRRTIEEIMLESRSSHFTVAEALYSFIRSGAIHLEAGEPSAAMPQPTPPTGVRTLQEDESEDEVAAMVARAQAKLQINEYEKALRLLKAAQNLDPNSAIVKNAMKGAETVIASEVKKAGILESKVPKICKSFEEITSMNFTPNEGFILSRINGVWDFGSIMKISPMREIDALLIFHKLYKDEIITF
ncbi:MAG TPA: DUF4388 domain-containing protein [Thermoanaerobaculia bacterium]|nr:DUF4388 domain-containing protein [Thermoanaerobaculia bacterium]